MKASFLYYVNYSTAFQEESSDNSKAEIFKQREKWQERIMYYWSRWTGIPTTETGYDEMKDTRSSWRETSPRLMTQRQTRPVVVVARNRTQQQTTSHAYQRARETGSGISLDVRRSTHAFSSGTRSYPSASNVHDATTQPVLEAFRLR
jgi:hypothetical protein